MGKMIELGENNIEIVGGLIMTRLTAKPEADDEVIEERGVIIPKCINSDGTINTAEIPTESLKVAVDPAKLTATGDIVMKLSTPYDAAIIDEDSAGCVVPSFCARIRNVGDANVEYLLAFLNSEACKSQLRAQISGAVMTVLSVGKIKRVRIPLPSKMQQEEIGRQYMETQKKLQIVRKIVELEAKKNDIIFRDMVREYE